MTVDISEMWETFGEHLDAEVPVNAEGRKQALADAISETDIDKLLDLNEKLGQVINQITANDLSEYGDVLTPEQAHALMTEHLDQEEIRELLDIRKKMRKAAIFRHITACVNDEFGDGEVPVPELKKKFVRQGGKVKYVVDERVLSDKLGPDRVRRVYKTTFVPASVKFDLDHDALAVLAQEDPEVMEIIRECVVPGGRTPLSLFVRAHKQ